MFDALVIVELQRKEMRWVSYATCDDIVAQVFDDQCFLFLDMLTLKLRITIILSTDRPKKVLPTACKLQN